MRYLGYNPAGYEGEADRRLPGIVKELRRVLSRTRRTFAFRNLLLGPPALEELSGVLAEFAVDVHCGIGIWESYETYNRQWFGTPLPMSLREAEGKEPTGIHPARLRHLLWVLYPELKEGLVLAPFHQDLLRVAQAAHEFLNDHIPPLPTDAGAKQFLATSDEYGWDVKRKLVWLGTKSYLFRLLYGNYVAQECDGKADIGHTDDFVCSQCTRWSGLGALDILAQVLDIGEDDRGALRGWYERHMAPYKILSANRETLRALNTVSDEEYVVRINTDNSPFKAGQLVFGSLVPWRGEWYWSGTQRLLGEATEAMIGDLSARMKRQNSQVLCRYWKDYERQVRERASELHLATMKYHGNDLVVYPDGLSMAADWQKEMRLQWEARPAEQVNEVMVRHGLKEARPNMKLPDHLLNATGGIGVFLNPEEGKEVMTSFHRLLEGLARKGEGLTDDEKDVITGFITSEAVSPAFVKRVVQEHGGESIRAAFHLPQDSPDYWLDCLLRSRKGHFYRKRYPTLSVI